MQSQSPHQIETVQIWLDSQLDSRLDNQPNDQLASRLNNQPNSLDNRPDQPDLYMTPPGHDRQTMPDKPKRLNKPLWLHRTEKPSPFTTRGDYYHVHSLRSPRTPHTPRSPPSLGADDLSSPPVQPVECLLRTASIGLACTIVTTSAVSLLLVQATSPLHVGNRLDSGLSWTLGIPVGALAAIWELGRQGWLFGWFISHKGGLHGFGRPPRPGRLLAADILVETVLAVGSAICAFLAAFQAARHASYNRSREATADATTLLASHAEYLDIGVNIALTVLLAFLMLSSFGILSLALTEVIRRRQGSRSSSSSNSSVIEIIRPK